MGIGRLELLGHIQRTGSINQAAKAMNMSYKRAWEMVHSMNTQANAPLVTTQTGGEKGGRTIITAEGDKYLTYYRGLQERFQKISRRRTGQSALRTKETHVFLRIEQAELSFLEDPKLGQIGHVMFLHSSIMG